MGNGALILIGLSLSMDALAVSISSSMQLRRVHAGDVLRIALVFGFLQGLMPIIGFFLASLVADIIHAFDHWVAFILLALIGAHMIMEAIKGGEEESKPINPCDFKRLVLLGIATSIDALAVGVTFAFLNVNIWFCGGVIAGITFLVCALGVVLGRHLGKMFQKSSEIIGGCVLIGIGLKIFIEHMFLS